MYVCMYVCLCADDPLIWEGNASLVDELAATGRKPGAIVLSVGGGGLLCGVQRGLVRNGWQVRLQL